MTTKKRRPSPAAEGDTSLLERADASPGTRVYASPLQSDDASSAAASDTSYWVESRDGDPTCFAMYRRHYSSKKNKRPKQRQFVGPGERIVLAGMMCSAMFVWTKRIRDDGQAGINCSVFRNESSHRSSSMIREAMKFALAKWPGQRLFTMVDAKEIVSTNPGYCFLMAGWRRCGRTKKGLLILEFIPPAEVA